MSFKESKQTTRQLLLNALNNIKFTDQKIRDVKTYVRTKQLPEFDAPYAMSKQKHFLKLFGNNNYEVKEGSLYYKPLNKEIAPDKKQEEIMQELYDDDKVGLGTGIKSFHNKVADKYAGIGTGHVNRFLKDQTSYQITKPEPKVVNKPIITRYPNERWQIDLVDVAVYAPKNKNFKYILTVIDNFSKYVFAMPLKNKTAEDILEAMMDIISNQADETYPSIIQSDNGGEFKNALFREWAKNNRIKLKLSMSYQPTSNALIENYNNILRKMIREGFVRHNNLNWVDHLGNYLYNRNHSKHSTTGYKPIDLWRVGREKVKQDDDDKYTDAQQRIQKKAKKALDRYVAEIYRVGDTVRVLETSLHSNARKILKAGNKKLIIATYSPDLYTVAKIFRTKGKDAEFVRPRYFLYDKHNRLVDTEFKKNNPNARRAHKLFFASELQKIENPQKISKKLITQETTADWNQMQIDYDDEEEKKKQMIDAVESKVHQTRSQTKKDSQPKVHNTRSRGLTK